MKRKFILTFGLFLVSVVVFAGKLVLIPVNETHNLETLFHNNALKIHYYCNNYVIATTENLFYENAIVLDENAFENDRPYAIAFCFDEQKNDYLTKISNSAKILYSGDNFLIMKILSDGFVPAKSDGMIAILDIEARLLKAATAYPIITEADDDVLSYLAQVSTDRLMADIQTLQDFKTRNCKHSNIFDVRDWIQEQFDTLDVNVTLHNFPYYNNDNVIAIQYGTEFPDEYVICGAHYDSFTFASIEEAPGADDNATGIAGILETARILSQYDFKRSIIYCAFSAEEDGLIGSSYYAGLCANQEMNIVGYFNLDMTGYLPPENEIRIDLVHYVSSQSLANYYFNICDVYFHELPVESYYPQYGSSDYASFNNVGYQAIHPHEDYNGYNPYIHTVNDTIALSVNAPELATLFTKANVASIATLAKYDVAMPPPPKNPPTNCVAQPFHNRYIKVTWNAPTENTPNKYYVYRDDVKIIETTALEYVNTISINDYNIHCYKVTAVYGMTESEYSNESCTSINAITEFDPNFIIYPNPATEELTITNYELQITNVKIIDITGKTLSSHHLIPTSSHHIINISHLPTGIYFVKASNKTIGKFVKN